tara:strand:- start:3289 stop:3897 length:609 start_codon:yes stop_codon:yes gene_type:complete
MSQLKLTADGGGGTVSLKGPASTTGNAAIELTVPGTGSSTLATTATAGKILQVVSSHKVNSFATTSTSFVDLTGLSRTITPTAASSKINIIISLHVGGAANSYPTFNVLRGSTIVTQGTNGTGNMTNCSFGTYVWNQDIIQTIAYTFLDSPSYSLGDTLTYKLQIASKYNSHEVTINRTNAGTNASYSLNGTSTITLMEVAA